MVGWWDVKQSMKTKWKQIARKKFKTRRGARMLLGWTERVRGASFGIRV